MNGKRTGSFREINEACIGDRIVNWTLGVLVVSTAVLLAVFLIKS